MKEFRLMMPLVLALIGVLVWGNAPVWSTDAAKSAYDFHQLRSVIDADQIDYFTGDWSYTMPLMTVQGAGGLALPLQLQYSSAITGVDRLTKLKPDHTSRGTYTVNNAGWVGLGWNLNIGAITVTGGYTVPTNGHVINHPFAFDLAMTLPDGMHRLVRQTDGSGQPTNSFFEERRQFWRIEWMYDAAMPLTSTWTAYDLAGKKYTFGKKIIGSDTFGANLTMRAAVVADAPLLADLTPEFVYEWRLAEIVDPAGNAIRFKYVADGPLTTFRTTWEDTTGTGQAVVNTFRNYLQNADLAPGWPTPFGPREVMKTQKTAHLSEVFFSNQSGQVVRKIETQTLLRSDLPPTTISIDNLTTQNVGQLRNPAYFRALDGLDTNQMLKALIVKNAQGLQLARFDFEYDSLTPKPPVAPGDTAHRLLLLKTVSIQGKDLTPGLPAYTFDYSAADSYRLARVTLPTGGSVSMQYEAFPNQGSAYTTEDSLYARSRRVAVRTIDPDKTGESLPTQYVYAPVDVWTLPNTNYVERLTHPWVKELLSNGYGTITRDYVSKADLTWLNPLIEQQQAERLIRRGLLKAETRSTTSDQVVQTNTTTWVVTPIGNWLGSWAWYYHPGIAPQSYWVRPDTVAKTLDGVRTLTQYAYNATNGLVSRELVGTLSGGAPSWTRETDTCYQGDDATSVTWGWAPPVVTPAPVSYGTSSYTTPAATFNGASASIPGGGVSPFESVIEVTYKTLSWTAPAPLYRVQGFLGCDQVSGIDTESYATVYLDWSNNSTSTVASFHAYFPSGSTPAPSRVPYSVLVVNPSPSGTLTAKVRIVLQSDVWHNGQTVARSIRTYSDSLRIDALNILSSSDPEYTQLWSTNTHIWDQPQSVLVRDTNGQKLRYTEYRYGNFAGKLLPDTTVVWQDLNEDHELTQSQERLVQQRVLSYDNVGNPLEVADANGIITTTRWGYRKMLPVAQFANARSDSVEAWVFEDYPDFPSLQADGWYPSTGTGTITVTNGTLQVAGTGTSAYAAIKGLTANNAGVLDCDAMMDVSTGDSSAITIIANGSAVAQWKFGADGLWWVTNGPGQTSLGVPYQANRWYHFRIEWNAGTWWARIDGTRYPATGSYACGSGTGSARIEVRNGPGTGAFFVDNLRKYPVTAQPLPMTTGDPVTLNITAVADANGVPTFYDRDGLGRVIRTRDASRRVLSRHYAYFSRDWEPFYFFDDPNQEGVAVYADSIGHRTLENSLNRTVAGQTIGTGQIVTEEGGTLTTATIPGAYLIQSGGTVTFRAGGSITLTPGFEAQAGATFQTVIDPAIGSYTGTVTFNIPMDGENALKLGAQSTLTKGAVASPLTARAEFYPEANAPNGSVIPKVLAFDDGSSRCAIQYVYGSPPQFRVEVVQGGGAPRYVEIWNLSNPVPSRWYTCELELTSAGTCYAWVTEKDGPRNPNARGKINGYPLNWTPVVKAQSDAYPFDLANLYVGPVAVTTTWYDGFAREIETKVRTGGDDILTKTTYDNTIHKPSNVIGPVGGNGESYTYVNAPADGGKRTWYAYASDPLARLARVIPPGYADANAVKMRYGNGGAGWPPMRYESTIDENGLVTSKFYNHLGQLLKAVADSATGGLRATTQFSYNPVDQLTMSIAPLNDATRYTYDTLGRLVKKYQPDADTTWYKYDKNGNLRFSQDARQAAATPKLVTFYVYDAVNRVTRVGEATLTTPAPTTFAGLDPTTSYAFEADTTSWRTKRSYDIDYLGSGGNYAEGRLTKIEENTKSDAAAVTVLLAYDREGRVRAQQVTLEGLSGAKLVQYAYDLAGRVTKVIYPDTTEARLTYDAAGRVSTVTDANGNAYAAYTYAPDGNLATHTVGNNLATGTYTFTVRDWLQKLHYANVFLDTLQYDYVGNVTQQVYRQGTSTTRIATYGYDTLHRLTSFSLPADNASQSFAYDRNGNLTSRTTNGNTLTYNYSYTSTPNRLDSTTGTGGLSYGYNPCGWMLNRGADSLYYDYRGLTTGYKKSPATLTTYLMDSEGNRAKKVDGTTTVYYIRGGDGAVLAEYDGTSTLTTKYVYAGTKRLAMIASSSTQYYLTDHLGDTRVLLKSDGSIPTTYDYWPYGGILLQGGTDGTRFKFTGHERDGESGLDNMVARLCAPEDGRFLRPDPLAGKYPHLSPYAYAANNPLKFVDPNGKEIRNSYQYILRNCK